jgi:hypothetical protein
MSGNAGAIWRQTAIPVIYRPGRGVPLKVKLPYAANNYVWLRDEHRNKPKWNEQFTCWELPSSWFEDVVRRSLARFGRVWVIQPHRAQETCAPACWRATGIECECACMGARHGSENPAGKWHIVSETFAVQWHDRQINCRLIKEPDPHK